MSLSTVRAAKPSGRGSGAVLKNQSNRETIFKLKLSNQIKLVMSTPSRTQVDLVELLLGLKLGWLNSSRSQFDLVELVVEVNLI